MIEIIGLQGNVISGSPERNLEHMRTMLQENLGGSLPSTDHVRWIITPELFLTGYDFKKLKEKQLLDLNDLTNPVGSTLLDILRTFESNIIIGFPERDGSNWYNTIAAFDVDGNILAKYQKIHLFKPFSEHQLFMPGNRDFVKPFTFKGTSYGLEICYDIRFPELSRILTLQGAEVLFIPAQFPHPRAYVWETLLRARAIENQLFVVAVNRVGETSPNRFFGLSVVFDPLGMINAQSPQDQATVLFTTIDTTQVKSVRESLKCLKERRMDVY